MRLLYSLLTVLGTAVSVFAQSSPPYLQIISNSPVCEGQSFRMYATYQSFPTGTTTSFRWSGPNGFTSEGSSTLNNIIASPATAGVYSVTMTYSGTANGTATASTTVALGLSKPEAYVTYFSNGFQNWSPSYSICSPTSLSLTAFPDRAWSLNPATYRWTGPNGFTSDEQRPVVPQVVAGLYIVEATYPGNCGTAKDTVTISNFSPSAYINTLTVEPTPKFTTVVCPGEAISFQAALSFVPQGATTSYQWSGPNGFTSNAQSFTLTNTTATMSGTYSVTVTISGTCSGTATASRTITIDTPTVWAYILSGNTIYTNPTLCPSSNFVVFASSSSSAGTYQWSGPNGFTSNTASTTLTNANTTMTGVYSVTATFPGGCTNSASTTVTIGTPSVQIFGNSYISEGDNIQLSAQSSGNTTTTYQWAGPNGFTSNNQNFSLANATTAMAGTYSVTATFSGNCSGTAIAFYFVNVVTPSVTIYSSENGRLQSVRGTSCPGSSPELMASASSSNATFRWSGPNGFTSSVKSFTLANVTPAMAGIYSVTATFSSGATATSSFTFTVGTPSVYVSGFIPTSNISNRIFCPGSTFQLRPTTGATSYQWSGPNGFTSTSANPALTNATPAMSGTYSVTATFAGGCSNVGSTSITVGTPIVQIYSDAYNLALGGSFQLTAYPEPNVPATYQWNGPNGFTGNAQSFTLNNATAAMAGTYSVTATFSGDCSGASTASQNVFVRLPYVIVTGKDHLRVSQSYGTYCPGSSVELTAEPSPPSATATFRWSGPNGFASTEKRVTLTNLTSTLSGVYSVTATFPDGTTRTGTFQMTVSPPSIYFTKEPVACPGSPLVLSVSNSVSAPATYQWSGPNGFTSNTQSFTLNNATAAMTGTYSVTATLTGVCTGTATTSGLARVGLPMLTLTGQSPEGNSWTNYFCPGSSFSIQPLFSSFSPDKPPGTTISYRWTGPNGFTSTDKRPTIATPTTAASGLYSLIAIVTGECSGEYTASTDIQITKPVVTVATAPVQGIASIDGTYCEGTTVLIGTYSRNYKAIPTAFRWSGPNGFTSTEDTVTVSNLTPAMAGVYSVTVTYEGQCASQRVGFAYIDVATPKTEIGLFRENGAGSLFSFPLCPGNRYNLSAQARASNVNEMWLTNTYEWTLPNGTTATGPRVLINGATTADAGRYILKTTYTNGCSGISLDTMDINVGLPIPRLSTDRDFIANGRSTLLYSIDCTDQNTVWSDGQIGSSIVVAPTQTTSYTAVCQADGCSSQPSAPLTIRVSDRPEADLSLQMAVSSRSPEVNKPLTVRLSVVNSSTLSASNVQVRSRLPAALSVVNAGSMQVDNNVLTGTLASIPTNGKSDLTFDVAPALAGAIQLAAQITASDNPDPDSAPDNGTNNGQDDVAWVTLRTQQYGPEVSVSPEPAPAPLPRPVVSSVSLPFGKVDLSLALAISNPIPRPDEIITVTILLNNVGNRDLLSPDVTCELPAGLSFVDSNDLTASGQQVTLAGGKYYQQWPRLFTFRARATGPVTEPIKARISYCDWDDVDSDPTNGFDTGEDDTAQIRLRVR